MFFDLLKEEFLSYLRLELNRSTLTVKGYRKDFNVFQRYLREKCQKERIKITEISTDLISRYLQYLAVDLQHQPRTRRRHLAALKSFFNFAVLQEYIAKSPAENIIAPQIPQRQPTYLEKEQVEALFRTITPDTPLAWRDLTMLKTLFYSGIRVQELVDLKWQHIDFEYKILKIVKGKGEKYRNIPLHPELEKQLNIYLQEGPFCQDDYLFCNYRNESLGTETVRLLILRCAKEAGLKQKVTPHVLRHSFATILFKDCGVDLRRLAELLGHSSIRHTTVYAHSDIRHLREAIEVLPAPGEKGIRIKYPTAGKDDSRLFEKAAGAALPEGDGVCTLELQEGLDRYLDYVKYVQNFKPPTCKLKKTVLKTLFAYLKETVSPRGILFLKDIKTAHLRQYMQYINTEKKYKPTTLYTVVTHIKAFFKYAFQQGLIEVNPAAKLVNPKIPPREVQFLKWDEVQHLFNSLEPETKNYLRNLTILKTLYYTGMRAQELCNLKVENLDMEKGMLTIESGKGDKWRPVPVHSYLQKVLCLYLAKGRNSPDAPFLFTNSKGEAIPGDNLYYIFKELKRKLAVTDKKLSPHIFRHTFATHLYQGGVDLRRISLLLGHVNINHTVKYTHTSPEHLREAIDLL